MFLTEILKILDMNLLILKIIGISIIWNAQEILYF
jgi:hypothetical protein